MPFYAVGTNYSPTGNSLEGTQTPEFNATVGPFLPSHPHQTCSKQLTRHHAGLYYVTLAVLTFVYLICSIRTNACLFLALFLLVITFSLFAAVYFQIAAGNMLQAEKLQMVHPKPWLGVVDL